MTPSNTSPEQWTRQGKKAFKQGDLSAAIQAFTAEQAAYHQAGQETLADEMANNLSVVLLQADRPQEALQAVQGTPQRFKAADDLPRSAMAWGNLGAALEAVGETEASADAYQTAIEIFRDLGMQENLLQTAQSLSKLRLQQGRVPEAMSAMQGGLQDPSKLPWRHRFLRRILDLPSRLLGQ